jgi:predicted aspartyl protease
LFQNRLAGRGVRQLPEHGIMKQLTATPTRRNGGVLLGCLPLGLLLAACEVGAPARIEAPADTAAGEVAFRLAGPQDAALLVPVYVNDQGPFDFVLDTGATLTCIEQQTAEQLALPRERGVRGVGTGIGSAGPVELVRVDSLRLGAARAFDITACVLDLQHLEAFGPAIHGLVGLNFLRSFRVTLDFQRNVLILVEP